MKHQLLLVSAQPMPNFLPILNSEQKVYVGKTHTVSAE